MPYTTDSRGYDKLVEDNPEAVRILAEGDSWFSIGGFPGSNLLFPLRLPRPAILVSLAQPGDTIRRMSSIASNHPDVSRNHPACSSLARASAVSTSDRPHS